MILDVRASCRPRHEAGLLIRPNRRILRPRWSLMISTRTRPGRAVSTINSSVRASERWKSRCRIKIAYSSAAATSAATLSDSPSPCMPSMVTPCAHRQHPPDGPGRVLPPVNPYGPATTALGGLGIALRIHAEAGLGAGWPVAVRRDVDSASPVPTTSAIEVEFAVADGVRIAERSTELGTARLLDIHRARHPVVSFGELIARIQGQDVHVFTHSSAVSR